MNQLRIAAWSTLVLSFASVFQIGCAGDRSILSKAKTVRYSIALPPSVTRYSAVFVRGDLRCYAAEYVTDSATDEGRSIIQVVDINGQRQSSLRLAEGFFVNCFCVDLEDSIYALGSIQNGEQSIAKFDKNGKLAWRSSLRCDLISQIKLAARIGSEDRISVGPAELPGTFQIVWKDDASEPSFGFVSFSAQTGKILDCGSSIPLSGGARLLNKDGELQILHTDTVQSPAQVSFVDWLITSYMNQPCIVGKSTGDSILLLHYDGTKFANRGTLTPQGNSLPRGSGSYFYSYDPQTFVLSIW